MAARLSIWSIYFSSYFSTRFNIGVLFFLFSKIPGSVLDSGAEPRLKESLRARRARSKWKAVTLGGERGRGLRGLNTYDRW